MKFILFNGILINIEECRVMKIEKYTPDHYKDNPFALSIISPYINEQLFFPSEEIAAKAFHKILNYIKLNADNDICDIQI